jgi:hypothetical protein
MNASLKPSPNSTETIPSLEVLRARLKRLNLYGLLAQAEQIRNEPASPYIRCKKCRFDDATQHGF